MSEINICIIDDHEMVRQGLKELLANLGGFKVVSEFANGNDFLKSLPLETQPDVYILDYSMPNMNGVEVLKLLEEKEENLKVLLFSQYIDEIIISEAYTYGARGFLEKSCSAHELKFTLENIVKIGYNNVSEILKRNKNEEPKNTQKQKIKLTPRELEFLTLVCDENEYTYDQMAEKVGVSVKSIDAYRNNMFEKYNIKSKVGLVLFSYKHQLTEPFL